MNHVMSCVFRVVITVLDNFHFDLSGISSMLEVESAKTRAQQLKSPSSKRERETVTSEVKEKEDDKMDVSDKAKEEELEAEEELEVEKEEEMEVEEEGAEGKSMALKIYRAVTKVILPSLQEVLTKKVHCVFDITEHEQLVL